jgi:hypothetical protein
MKSGRLILGGLLLVAVMGADWPHWRGPNRDGHSAKLRPGPGKVWAHPVIANGKLILRDYGLLFVYDVGR